MVWSVSCEGPLNAYAFMYGHTGSDFPHGQDSLEHPAGRSWGAQLPKLGEFLLPWEMLVFSPLRARQTDPCLRLLYVEAKVLTKTSSRRIRCTHANGHGMRLSSAMCQSQEAEAMSYLQP